MKPVSNQGVGSPSASGSAWRGTTSVPQAPGGSQDGFLLTGATDSVQVLNAEALVFVSTLPRVENLSKDEFPSLLGTQGITIPPLGTPAWVQNDTTQHEQGPSGEEPSPSSGLAAAPFAVPPDAAAGIPEPEQGWDDFSDDCITPAPEIRVASDPSPQDPAGVYEKNTQQGNGSSGDESLPSSGLAAAPVALPPDSAAGTLVPEQEKNDLSRDDFFPSPGSSKNPINLDPEGVLVKNQPIRWGFFADQDRPWGILYDFTNKGSSAKFSDAEEGADFSKKISLNSEAASGMAEMPQDPDESIPGPPEKFPLVCVPTSGIGVYFFLNEFVSTHSDATGY